MKMQLGIISKGFEKKDFERVSSLGLSFLELCINVGVNVEDFTSQTDKVNTRIKETGVAIGSIGRWGTDRILPDGTFNDSELNSDLLLIEAAGKVGCTNFICGCNYIESLSYFENCRLAISYLEILMQKGEECGVLVSTYNCHWNNFITNDMAWTMIHGHLPKLGIKFDPSHSIYAGGNYLSEMVKWGNRFYHVHLKGSLYINNERIDDPPAGMDGTNWGAFMGILYKHGYNRTVSIEPHSTTWHGELGDAGILYTVDYFKKMVL